MRFTPLLGLALLLLPQGCGPAASEPRDMAARLPDGRRLMFRCAGRGSPTVIFESGWGSRRNAWEKVLPEVAKRTRACAYDRAGYGDSTPGPLPRDGAAIARDLDRGLRAAKIDGPYVLVGHSAGALYVRQFAERRPRDAAGMVLVDGSVEFQPARFERAFGPGAGAITGLRQRAERCLAEARARPSPATPLGDRCRSGPPEAAVGHWAARESELATMFDETSRRLAQQRRGYGAMPLIVLTGGRTYQGTAAELWAALHREVAALSTRGQWRLVADSGHAIQTERPQAVITAVGEVIAMARRQGAGR